MATLRKIYTEQGYCPIDKCDVSIEIEYSSIPLPTDKSGYRVFFKSNNRCFYLNDGECDAGIECPVFKAAEARKTDRYHLSYR